MRGSARVAILVFAGLVLLVTGCRRGNEAADQQALLDNVAAVGKALGSGDTAALIGMMTPRGRLFPPNREPVSGREALQGLFDEMTGAGLEYSLDNEDVAGDRNLAYTAGRYTVKGPDGVEMDHGAYLAVWRRMPEGWKLHRMMWTSAVTPPEAPAEN